MNTINTTSLWEYPVAMVCGVVIHGVEMPIPKIDKIRKSTGFAIERHGSAVKIHGVPVVEGLSSTFRMAMDSFCHVIPNGAKVNAPEWLALIAAQYDVTTPRNIEMISAIYKTLPPYYLEGENDNCEFKGTMERYTDFEEEDYE